MTTERVFALSKIDPWFLREHRGDHRRSCASQVSLGAGVRCAAPSALGFSDVRLASCSTGSEEATVRARRARRTASRAVYKTVDTCAAEFEAHTPYFYSTYEAEDESRARARAARS